MDRRVRISQSALKDWEVVLLVDKKEREEVLSGSTSEPLKSAYRISCCSHLTILMAISCCLFSLSTFALNLLASERHQRFLCYFSLLASCQWRLVSSNRVLWFHICVWFHSNIRVQVRRLMAARFPRLGNTHSSTLSH